MVKRLIFIPNGIYKVSGGTNTGNIELALELWHQFLHCGEAFLPLRYLLKFLFQSGNTQKSLAMSVLYEKPADYPT